MSGEIRSILSHLFPAGGVVEVRALGDYATHSGYFDDYDTLAEKAEFLDRLDEVRGVYVTLNEVNPALLSRRANRIKLKLGRKDATTADADIIRRKWLPVDLDPVRPSGVSSSETEHVAALERAGRIARWLSEQGFSEPIRADSGNGAHMLYALDLENDDAATALVKACLVTLDALFSDTVVAVDTANFNASRIWKLYGTTSKKGDNTPDRPHRTARLLSGPDEITIVPAERLQHLAGLLPRDEPKPAKKTSTAGIDLRGWLSAHGLSVRSERPWQGGTLFVLEECPFSSAHKDGAFAIQFGNGAVFAGCHHASCGGGIQRWPELRARYEPRKKRIQKKQEDATVPPAPDPAPPEHREKALEILRGGNPLAFLLDTFNREHVGDRIVAECLIMSVASQSVANTKGLHVAISGTSGKGKTHACNAMLALLPEHYRLKGSVSNKALFYHDSLRPGTVLLFDDISLSDDLQELLKSATANFREPIEHRTLTTDRQLRLCTIPERCVWWLAKVESVGDDQVMNRMLTVWIDDSKGQDREVLEHMKLAEAAAPGEAGEAEDVLVCRAIWEVLKELTHHVRIPFAPRIHFSAVANRRNPGMLFDLIKCHALLHAFQRERDESGCILATGTDFTYATRLFRAINGDTGGQETKLTKNEAAALSTVAGMGVAVFTIRMLQEAMGLSYHQTRRIMNGYINRGISYAGLLEKCPAIGCTDATVTEEGCGPTIRRREHHYSFDAALYRSWSTGTVIWLDENGEDDDDDDTYTTTADVHPMYTTGCHDQNGECNEELPDTPRNATPSTSLCTDGHHNRTAQSGRDTGMASDEWGCDPGDGVHRDAKTAPEHGTLLPALQPPPLIDSTRCPPVYTAGSLLHMPNPSDYLPLPVEKDGPCHVCGGRPVSSLRNVADESAGPPQYLCSDCLNKAQAARKRNEAKGIVPLPGVLRHQDFVRTPTELGRCRICDGARAVYRSKDVQTCICEACFGRLVREWNAGEGVR